MAKSLEERTTSAKRIYEGKVVNLRVDTIVLPDGKTAQREVVEHRGAVAVIPLKDDGTVILVRQWRTPARAALLEIPAGSIDPDEEAAAAAGRELGEEINLQAGRLTKLFETYMAPGYSTEIIHYFLAEDLTPFQGEPDDDENIEVVTVTLAEAIEKIKTGEIHDAKSVSGLLWVEDAAHMKLGVSMWSYVAAWKRGEMDIPGFIYEAKKIGADGVELLDYFWKDREAELPAVERALAETGLPLGVYSVGNNFALPDPAERAAQIQVVKDGVDNAVHFGAMVVRVFAGNPQPDIGLSDAFDWIVRSFQEVVGYAQEKGVTLALENHGALAGRSEQVALILQAVGNPALAANPDTGNFLLVHDTPHDAVARLASRAAMVHFKDFRLMPDDYDGPTYTAVDGLEFAGTAIGEGDVALADCLASLRAAGFNGWVNVEYEAPEDPLTGVARSVANARRLLEVSGE